MSSKFDSKKKKKVTKSFVVGVIHINVSFNNTIVTITDTQGNKIASASAGQKFKGSKKATPYAAQDTVMRALSYVSQVNDETESYLGDDKKDDNKISSKNLKANVTTASVCIKGPGLGRESALRAITSSGIIISALKDVTPVPHNGCRPPKKRRV